MQSGTNADKEEHDTSACDSVSAVDDAVVFSNLVHTKNSQLGKGGRRGLSSAHPRPKFAAA